MRPHDIRILAAQLHAARRAAAWAALSAVGPANLDEAYAVQAEIVRLSGGTVRGWKVTALKPADQEAYGGERPVAGPLLSDAVYEAPAELVLSAFLAPVLECEFAFLLGRDLPARTVPYTLDEVADAVAAIVPAFEIADGRVPPEAPGALRLADSMGNGAFVYGAPLRNWRGFDRAGPVSLMLDGMFVEDGSGGRILGDPLKAVLALANAQPLSAPLLAGQIVTTGTATTPLRVTEPCLAVADFGPLGVISLRLTA